jgi:NADH-quinone oxidoreductase subunit N
MNDPYLTAHTLMILLPEILLLVLAVIVYLGGAFLPDRTLWNLITLLGLGVVGYALSKQGFAVADVRAILDGPLLVDNLANTGRWLSLARGVIFVLASTNATDDSLATEYLGSLLLLVAGLMLVCSAGDLVLLFLGLELISIPTYILIFLGRRDRASHEATTKYFFLSILSSALLLYGFSFFYGIGGSTELETIRLQLSELQPGGLASLLPLAVLFILAGLAFKIAAVPFHFYAPDVYEGTTADNAGILAVMPKIAGVLALVRIMCVAMPVVAGFSWQIVLAVAILSMTLGNTLALWQQNVRRMLAYSSIAHAGYLLIGLAVALAVENGAPSLGRSEGIAAMFFYLIVYALATSGAFVALAYLAGREREVNRVEDLAGLGRVYPLIAGALALFLFSLAGLPPLAGFWGKFTLFLSALDVGSEGGLERPWFLALAIIAALNAAIAAVYYLRLISVMYFREPVGVPQADGGSGPGLATLFAAALLLAASFLPGTLIEASGTASKSARILHEPARPAMLNAEQAAR